MCVLNNISVKQCVLKILVLKILVLKIFVLKILVLKKIIVKNIRVKNEIARIPNNWRFHRLYAGIHLSNQHQKNQIDQQNHCLVLSLAPFLQNAG